MEKSKVYYTNLRTGFNNGLLDKLKRLIKAAGIENIDFVGANHFSQTAIRFMSAAEKMLWIIWILLIQTAFLL